MDDWRYRELYELEDRHWWFRGRRAVIWALLNRAGVHAPLRLLDAGCGTGRNLVEFGGLGEGEGVDFSPQAVQFCRGRGLAGVRQASLEELPFEAGRFDLILATDVIEHLEDDHRALTELRRVAAPGARLVLTVPAYQWLWSAHDVSMHHRRRYTAHRLRQRISAAGWETRVQTYFFTAVLPAVAAVRLVRDANGAQGSDLDLTMSAVNRPLELLARAEAALIALGIRLPAGVSLGMVCTPG